MRRLGWFFNDDFNPDPMSDAKAIAIVCGILLFLIII